MTLAFDPISSPNASRDLFIDFSNALEADETLMEADAVSVSPSVLTVSHVAINDKIVEFDGVEIGIGRGVHFTIKTIEKSQATVPIYITFMGNTGTEEKYKVLQPVVTALCQ